MVPVPVVIGHPFSEAQQLLAQSNLSPGTITTVVNPNFGGGVVADQDPKNPTPVLTKSVVNLSITPQTTTVPPLAGMTINEAITALGNANLAIGSTTGDAGSRITSQNPDKNLTVQVGTKVNVVFPCQPPNCVVYANPNMFYARPMSTMQMRNVPPAKK